MVGLRMNRRSDWRQTKVVVGRRRIVTIARGTRGDARDACECAPCIRAFAMDSGRAWHQRLHREELTDAERDVLCRQTLVRSRTTFGSFWTVSALAMLHLHRGQQGAHLHPLWGP